MKRRHKTTSTTPTSLSHSCHSRRLHATTEGSYFSVDEFFPYKPHTPVMICAPFEYFGGRTPLTTSITTNKTAHIKRGAKPRCKMSRLRFLLLLHARIMILFFCEVIHSMENCGLCVEASMPQNVNRRGIFIRLIFLSSYSKAIRFGSSHSF